MSAKIDVNATVNGYYELLNIETTKVQVKYHLYGRRFTIGDKKNLRLSKLVSTFCDHIKKHQADFAFSEADRKNSTDQEKRLNDNLKIKQVIINLVSLDRENPPNLFYKIYRYVVNRVLIFKHTRKTKLEGLDHSISSSLHLLKKDRLDHVTLQILEREKLHSQQETESNRAATKIENLNIEKSQLNSIQDLEKDIASLKSDADQLEEKILDLQREEQCLKVPDDQPSLSDEADKDSCHLVQDDHRRFQWLKRYLFGKRKKPVSISVETESESRKLIIQQKQLLLDKIREHTASLEQIKVKLSTKQSALSQTQKRVFELNEEIEQQTLSLKAIQSKLAEDRSQLERLRGQKDDIANL